MAKPTRSATGAKKPTAPKSGTKKKPRAAVAKGRKPAIFEKSQPPETGPAPEAEVPPAQTLVGLLLIVAGTMSLSGFGFWLTGNVETDQTYWLARAGVQAIACSLIAVFPWMLMRRALVSYALILGILVAGSSLYQGGHYWHFKQQSMAASAILNSLGQGGNELGDLSESERRNPYIDAYLVMYDLYWELDHRADIRLANYTTAYKKYTRRSTFLDIRRFKSRAGLWRAAAQLYDLDRKLLLARDTNVDMSELLRPLSSVRIDRATRNAYRGEFLAKQTVINRAQVKSIDTQRKVIARTLNSINTLLEPRGKFYFEDGNIVFENPADAARFAGKKTD